MRILFGASLLLVFAACSAGDTGTIDTSVTDTTAPPVDDGPAAPDDVTPPDATPPQPARAAPAEDPEAVARLTGLLLGELGPASVDAAIEALARAGVRVFEDDGVTLVQEVAGPTSVLRLLRTQVANMTREVATGGGLPGRMIDEIAPTEGVPFGPSWVVAGWAATGAGFAPELSKALMAGQELTAADRARFPTLVLALFVAAILPDAADGQASGALSLGTRRGAMGDPCSAVNDFLENLPEVVSGAVSENISGVAGVVAGFIAGVFVQYSVDAIQGLVSTMGPALKLLAVLVNFRSLLMDWTIHVKAEPFTVHHSVGTDEVTGKLVAEVSGGDGAGPAGDCAKALGIPLPPKPPGSKIVWNESESFKRHAIRTKADEKVGDDDKATFDYKTVPESQEDHDNGVKKVFYPSVEVEVERRPKGEIDNIIDALMGNKLLGALAKQLTSGALEKLKLTLTYRGTGLIKAEWHGPPNGHIHHEEAFGPKVLIDATACPRDGLWVGTMSVSGPMTGIGPITWDFAGGTQATFTVTFPLTIEGVTGTYTEVGKATLLDNTLLDDTMLIGSDAGGVFCVPFPVPNPCSPTKLLNHVPQISTVPDDLCPVVTGP